MKYLLATTNKAKIRYYGTKLKEKGIDIITLNDINIDADVDETGKNPTENALIKATAYNKLSNLPTIAIDEGLFLEGLPDNLQPGTHVRRVNGKKLNDQEMIAYYKELVNKYGNNGKLTGYYLKSVAFIYEGIDYTYEYQDNCVFSSQQSQVVDEGYPLASIRIIPELNKFKSELTEDEEKRVIDISLKSIFEFILNCISELEKKEHIKIKR